MHMINIKENLMSRDEFTNYCYELLAHNLNVDYESLSALQRNKLFGYLLLEDFDITGLLTHDENLNAALIEELAAYLCEPDKVTCLNNFIESIALCCEMNFKDHIDDYLNMFREDYKRVLLEESQAEKRERQQLRGLH